MAEMEFEQPQDEYEEQPLDEVQDAEPEPEPDPEPQDPEVDWKSGVNQTLSEVVEWIRSQNQAPRATEAPRQERPKPDFTGNPIAQALWDRIEESDRRNEERWGRIERAKEENRRLEGELAQLHDEAEQYIASRVSKDDPQVKTEAVMGTLAAMGILRDRRIPKGKALELAYNAVAYPEAIKRARQNGQNEVRKPEARVPAPYRAPQTQRPQARPQMQPQAGPKPVNSFDARTARLKKERETLMRRLGQLSPDEAEDAVGGLS